MTRESNESSRRAFLGSTAAAVGAATGLTGLAGCSALPGDDEEPDPPSYDDEAVADVIDAGFPTEPDVFPVTIPDARFRDHESRATELIESVPASPDVPNEAVAKRIADERAHLAERFGDVSDTRNSRERLGRWRYYRESAAEVWGAYVAATDEYSRSDFQARYDRLRAEYNDFDETWTYRGPDPTSALVVHRAIEDLVRRGRDDVLTTGPFPTDPQAAVFEAASMIENHERAAAHIADARTYRTQYLDGRPNADAHRLRFAAAAGHLHDIARMTRRHDVYERALEDGRSALDADIGRGPAGAAFEAARRYAHDADWDVAIANARNDPASATFEAARFKHSHETFRAIVDAIDADEITWPEDESGLRALRDETIEALEAAWNTDPRPLAVELSAHAAGIVQHLDPRAYDSDIDDHDIARYVGTLHYATRLASRVPDLTDDVVDALGRE